MSAPRCRFCCGGDGEIVLDLGSQPACDSFPPAGQGGTDPTYPLRLWLCAACGLAQLAEDGTAPEEPRGVEPESLVRQAADAVRRVTAARLLPRGGTVAEYGSPHGGSWRGLLTAAGLRDVTDDPQARADVVLDCFGLMHAADQAAALRERVSRLADGGVLLLQFHSFSTIVRLGQWNALRHGHFAYYSAPALIGMLHAAGLVATTAWHFDLYGGTVLLAAARTGGPDAALRALLAEECAAGVQRPGPCRELQRTATITASALRTFLHAARSGGERVVGYGAASRAVPLLNWAGVGPELLPAVADASTAKHGRALPGVGIPVISPEKLAADPPDRVLLLVPDLLDEVRRALPEVERGGGRWFLAEPVPTPVGVDDASWR